jgi:hypothetical protein
MESGDPGTPPEGGFGGPPATAFLRIERNARSNHGSGTSIRGEPEEEKSLLSKTGAFEQQYNQRARHFATGTHSGLP